MELGFWRSVYLIYLSPTIGYALRCMLLSRRRISWEGMPGFKIRGPVCRRLKSAGVLSAPWVGQYGCEFTCEMPKCGVNCPRSGYACPAGTSIQDASPRGGHVPCRYSSDVKKDWLLERGIDPGIPCVENPPRLYPTTAATPKIGQSSQIRQSKRAAYINCLFLRYMRP